MKKTRHLKVGTKLILKTVPILMAILVAAFAYVIITTSNSSEKLSNGNLQTLAEKDASIVQSQLEEYLNVARTMAGSMQGFDAIDAQSRRSVYNGILKSILAENSSYLGVWCVWEPNALDGLDAKFMNKEGSDASGRFVPYWQRANGSIVLTPCVDYDKPGAGDYYLNAKNAAHETILDPYQYQIEGKNILMTTVSVPIKDESGKVIGVAGVDLSLSSLQNIAFDKGNFTSAYSYLISNSGIYVTHTDQSAIGQNLRNREKTNTQELVATVAQGKSYSYDSTSVASGKVVRRSLVPVTIGNTGTPWSFAIAVELNEITAVSRNMTFVLIIVLLVVLLVCCGTLLWTVRGSINKPLKKTAEFAKALASGDLERTIEIKSQDEVGQLANTLHNEVRQAFVQIEQARAKAVKQEQYQAVEVQKLLGNLQKLSNGDLNCDLAVSAADADTQTLYALYAEIAQNLTFSVSTIRQYIAEISQVLGEMANGNMNVEITTEYLGEFSELKNSINSIISALNATMTEIGNASSQVAAGTRQVSEGSQTISQGATEQASSIEELSSTITQVAAQIRDSADKAGEMASDAMESKNRAVSGNEKMERMLKAMEEIDESSESISRIIKVIDDIAFQTNILALNAAVEAARAGAHGKGFAVVAEEVRNLAAKSANAAKETTALIEGSIKKVEFGTQIAKETAEVLSGIVTGTQNNVVLLNGIASAANEQAASITQINTGISQLSQVVQTNSATAEEAAAASEELSSQAELLSNMVRQFKLKGERAMRQPGSGVGTQATKASAKRTDMPRISLDEM